MVDDYKQSTMYGLPQYHNKGVVTSIVIALAFVVCGAVLATQYIAYALGYAEYLGRPIFAHIYSPHKFLEWTYLYVQNTKLQSGIWGGVAIFICFSLTGSLVSYLSIWKNRRNLDKSDVHGSARFASYEEVKQAGITSEHGVYLGLYHDGKNQQYLQHDGQEHILVYAPTGSGKGVGVVVPTLLSWHHSAVIFDIKGENWHLTSGFRKDVLEQHVLKFEPLCEDESSCHWNPLWEVRPGQLEVSDAEEIAGLLVNPNGDAELDHWRVNAASLIKAAILHVIYAGKHKTLREVALLLATAGKDFDETLLSLLSFNHDPEGQYNWIDDEGRATHTHPVVQVIARAMLDKSEKERSGVQSTALSYLELFRDNPLVVKHTAKSDFLISDLTGKDAPVSLYLVVAPGDLERMKGLIRILLNFIDKKLTKKLDQNRHRLLMMMDEFPALGRLDFFQTSLAYSRGYGIKCVLITQDIKQLHKIYSRDEVVQSNAHIRVAMRPNTLETAKMLSEMTGMQTVMKHSRSFTGKRSKWVMSNMSESLTETQRSLLTADEISRLPEDKALIFVAGHHVTLCDRIKYYEDSAFMKRSSISAPAVSDSFYHTADSLKLPVLPKQEAVSVEVVEPLESKEIVELPPISAPVTEKEATPSDQSTNPFAS